MPAARAEYTITLTPGADAAAAARRLAAAGLEVSDVLEAIGVVTGRAPKSAQARLAQVPGVADVAPTLGFSVGPPDEGLG